MKKLILLCFFFIFSGSFYAQDSQTKSEPIKKETTKKKSSYNYDKDVPVKTPVKKVVVKSETKKTETKVATKKETVSKTTKKKTPILKESNEKAPKTPDKVTGEYNGKKVFTGPRGGKYYINKNGNKTYIQD